MRAYLKSSTSTFSEILDLRASNDRPVIKLFKYIGLLDASGRPQTAYREFVDHTKAKKVLAARLRSAYDDLYLSDKDAHTRTVESLTSAVTPLPTVGFSFETSAKFLE
jgi:hypothetical protein